MGLRDALAALAPPWLQGSVGARFLYSFGYMADAAIEKLVEGMRMHMPTLSDPTALPYLGADRRMGRGLYESDDAYAARLRLAFDTWRSAGSARGILGQVLAYVSPYAPRAMAVHSNLDLDLSSWDVYDAGASTLEAPTHSVVSPLNWDWDTVTYDRLMTRWHRVWIVVDGEGTGGTWAANGQQWGAGRTWGDGAVWGLDLPSGVGEALRAIVKQWKSAHTTVPWIVIAFGASVIFGPGEPAGDPTLPDGQWTRWSKTTVDANGVTRRVASRFSTARYISGPTEQP